MADTDKSDVYKKAREEREQHLQQVLTSKSNKKVVVAGPGTGKTHLFRRALVGKQPSLTLTFVNALVEDLSIELYGHSQVRTLHSFARWLLIEVLKKEIPIFPKLSRVIRDDLRVISSKDVDFDTIFHMMDEKNADLEFYKQRKKYYGDSYGYTDIIFAAVQFLKAHRERIPTYAQIVVDEFQDFNALEVALIDLLAERSPVLLAGDDDQALYDFKMADAKHIRERHNDAATGYESFNLPFCSRCPRVVVDAANDIVKGAGAAQLLRGRIAKPYKYFEDEAKDAESERYPKVTYSQLFSKQFAWFIEKKLQEMAGLIQGRFSILIIAPTKVQGKMLYEALRTKGFKNIEFAERSAEDVSLLDGLKLLLEDSKCNLGWRIVIGHIVKEADVKPLLTKTIGKDAPSLYGVIPDVTKKQVDKMLTVLRKVRDGKLVTSDDIVILGNVGVEPYRLGLEVLSDDLNAVGHTAISPVLRKMPITITTVPGSKGLAADVVFIMHFDDDFFVDKSGPTDKNVCDFLVALTRTKKKAFLVSSQKKQPVFLDWIDKGRILME